MMSVIKSCGCIFCDLALRPVLDPETGRPIHIVNIGLRRQIVPCGRDQAAQREPEKQAD